MSLEVEAVSYASSVVVLSDGQIVPITMWMNHKGVCSPARATTCVCGPDKDGQWYAVDLRKFTEATIN